MCIVDLDALVFVNDKSDGMPTAGDVVSSLVYNGGTMPECFPPAAGTQYAARETFL